MYHKLNAIDDALSGNLLTCIFNIISNSRSNNITKLYVPNSPNPNVAAVALDRFSECSCTELQVLKFGRNSVYKCICSVKLIKLFDLLHPRSV